MIKPSGSTLQRIAQCAASACLPQVRGDSSEYAERGRVLHCFLADCALKGRDVALANVPEEWKEAAEAMNLEGLPALKDGAAEVAFAYDYGTDTAREIGRNIGRNYGTLAEHEVVCTDDWVGVTDDAVVVIDWKSGHGAVTTARYNWQLRLGALAACRAYGKSRAIVEVVYVREGAPPYRDRAEFDAWDLDSFAQELVTIINRIATAEAVVRRGQMPNVVMGPECRYCPAFTACPGQTAIVRQLAVAPKTLEEEILAVLNPETAAVAYERYRSIKAVVAHMDRAFHAYAAEHPITTSDGRVFGPVAGPERIADQEGAIALLRDLVPEETMLPAQAKWTTSKELIRKHLGKKGSEEVFEAMRARGLLKSSVRIDEHKPNGKALPAPIDAHAVEG